MIPVWLRWAENHEETLHAHANLPHGDWCRLPPRVCTVVCMVESTWAWILTPLYSMTRRRGTTS
jgi:hypothetical protein